MKIQKEILCGSYNKPGSQNGEIKNALFNKPHSITQLSSSQFFISDTKNNSIKLLDMKANNIKKLDISLLQPRGLFMYDNNLIIADSINNTIKSLNIESNNYKIISPLSPKLSYPSAVLAIDDCIIISDTKNNQIVYLKDNKLNILAGTGKPGYKDTLDDDAQFNCPTQLVQLEDGNLLVLDSGNKALRHVNVGLGIVTTVSGLSKFEINYNNLQLERNPKYKQNSLIEDEKQMYLFDFKQIITRFQLFKQELATVNSICNYNDQVLIKTSTQLFLANNVLSDIQLLGALDGEFTCMIQDQFISNVIYAVESHRHVIYKITIGEFNEQADLSVNQLSINKKINQVSNEQPKQTLNLEATKTPKPKFQNPNCIYQKQSFQNTKIGQVDLSLRQDLRQTNQKTDQLRQIQINNAQVKEFLQQQPKNDLYSFMQQCGAFGIEAKFIQLVENNQIVKYNPMNDQFEKEGEIWFYIVSSSEIENTDIEYQKCINFMRNDCYIYFKKVEDSSFFEQEKIYLRFGGEGTDNFKWW